MSTLGTVNLNREESGWISANEVSNYLATKLGFPIRCDYKKFGGTSPFESYVRMRMAMHERDCLVPSTDGDIIEQILNLSQNNVNMKKEVRDILLPYMYPQDINILKQIIAQVNPDKLVHMGLCGENLNDIVEHAIPTRNLKHHHVGVYLRPELILKDMCIDPSDDNPGVFHIDYTEGDDIHGIKWQISVTKKVNKIAAITDDTTFTLDQIFSNN